MDELSRNRILTNRFIKSSMASSDWLSKLIDEAQDGTEFSDSDRIHIFNSEDSRVALSTQDSLSLVEALLGIPKMKNWLAQMLALNVGFNTYPFLVL